MSPQHRSWQRRGISVDGRNDPHIVIFPTSPKRRSITPAVRPKMPTGASIASVNRWRRADVWDRLLDAVSKAYDGDIQMIDSSSIRVHQHGANAQKKMADPVAWVARGAA
jgi:transposase